MYTHLPKKAITMSVSCRQVTASLHYLNSNCFICLFIFSHYFLSSSPFVHPIDSNARPLSFTIPQFNLDTENILYEGDATPSLGSIELNTVNEFFRVGRCTYTQTLHLWDSKTKSLAHFSTHFSFMIDNLSSGKYSDGLAFFLVPVGYTIPPNSAGGNLGLFNTTTRLGVPQNQIVTVEFDTWSNEWDPLEPHVGINVNTISSSVNSSWDVSSSVRKKTDVSIIYNATTMKLSVFWTNLEDPNPVYVDNFSLSYHVDLRQVLPEWVSIGFSAATGVNTEHHVIKSWEFSSHLNSDETSRKNRGKWEKTFLIEVVAVCVFILMLGVAICRLVVVRKRMKSHSDAVPSTKRDNFEGLAFPKRFGYQELVAATNNFANDRRLGHGGSGQVYKGIIQDLGYVVAVKRIFADSELHYEKIFINEVKIISRLIHRNLVQFIGWCHEQGECLLVYAYMPNSSLDNHLFGCRTTIQWDFRYKIALGLASALHYLHEDAEQCVLHRDIKSANVLLDNDFSTKLGDFGIAKLVDPRFRTQTTGIVGTFGYMAPEYANGGRASKESDMFSFGVVALEIACGRRTYQDGEYHVPLFRWVWQLYLAGNLLCVADERLEMNFDKNEMKCLLVVGLWCTNPNSKERPKAGQVMKVLQLEAPLPELSHDRREYEHPLPEENGLRSSSPWTIT